MKTEPLRNRLVRRYPWLLCVIAMMLLSTCSDQSSPPAPPTDAPATAIAASSSALSVSPPFNIGAVIARAHYSFRAEEGTSFSGGHDTYAVKFTPSGTSIEPVQATTTPGTDSAPPKRNVVRGAPLTIAVESVSRGTTTLSGPASAKVEKDGHLAVSRGQVVEHWRNTADGVDQSFSFATKPAGQGDLKIRVHFDGQSYAGSTSSGHHFNDPATGLGLCYGVATWIDANGKRTSVPAHYEENAIDLTVPADLVEGSSYPAVLDPLVSPETAVDVPIPLVVPPAAQLAPSIAFDGTNYMIVWQDNRGGFYAIYGARVAPSGVSLDPPGILISPLGGETPGVIFGRYDFFVVWHNNGGVYAGRVSIGGLPLDGPGFQISAGLAATPYYRPALAYNPFDEEVLVATSAGGLIQWTRLNPFGAIVATGNIQAGIQPAVVFGGNGYLVVWNTAGRIYGARLTRTGTFGTPNKPFVISMPGQLAAMPAVAFDGARFMVVWSGNKNGTGDIYAMRVNLIGTLADPLGILVSQALGDQITPAIAFDGNSYLVLWTDARNGNLDIFGSRVTTSANVLDPAGIPVVVEANSQNWPTLAFNGLNYRIAWADERGDTSEIFTGRLDKLGLPLDATGTPVCIGCFTGPSNEEGRPAVGFDGVNYLVVWRDNRGGNFDLYGMRVTQGGQVVDPVAFPIAVEPNDQDVPAVAYDGVNYLVVWEDLRNGLRDIYGTRVTPAGVALEPGGFAVATTPGDQYRPRVSFNGNDFLVVWEDNRNGDPDIFGTLVSPAAIVPNLSGFAISTAPGPQRAPRVEFDGVNYMVVWDDVRNATRDIYGARVGPTGALLDPAGLPISTIPVDQSQPALSFDGVNYLVVWTDLRNGTADLYGTRLTPAGVVLDAQGLLISASYQAEGVPVAAFNGINHVVVWEDLRAGNIDLFATEVTPAGVVLTPSGFVVSDAPENEPAAALAGNGQGQVLVAYQRFDPGAAFQNYRVRARIIGPLGNGGPCTAGTDCISGFCVDGLCCNTACGGGALLDCQACSVAAGATVDGVCAPVTAMNCEDGNLCTLGDLCQAGVCVSGAPVLCGAPPNACLTSGVCDAAQGICVYPAAPDGTVCDGGSCVGGVCTPTPPAEVPAEPDSIDASTSDGGDGGDGPIGVNYYKYDGGSMMCGAEGGSAAPAPALLGLFTLLFFGRRRARRGMDAQR